MIGRVAHSHSKSTDSGVLRLIDEEETSRAESESIFLLVAEIRSKLGAGTSKDSAFPSI
jgi:hypothetical protein